MNVPILATRRVAASILIAIAGVCAAATHGVGMTAITPANDCPDQGVQLVPSKTTYGPLQICGSGLHVQSGPVRMNSPLNNCPLFVIYEPPHHVPTKRVGFTANAANLEPISALKPECITFRLLWLIPLSSSCRQGKWETRGHIQNYVQVQCPVVERAPVQKVGPR